MQNVKNIDRKVAKIRLMVYTRLFQSVKNDVNTTLHNLLKEKIALYEELSGSYVHDDI